MTHKTTITYNYILITSDDEIKEGNYIFSTKSNNIFKADSIEYLEKHNLIEDFDKSFCISSIVSKKIIAHLPLNNAPQLEGVTLLPPLPSGEEKYRFTEEDMIRMAIHCWNTASKPVYGATYDVNEIADEYIQSLSQPKMPIGFKCEEEYDCCERYLNCKGCDATAEMINLRPKIINRVMQGEWIY